MKQLQTQVPRRARSMIGAVARSRKEAAIQMVRLEFESERLERSKHHAERRMAGLDRDLSALNARREGLLGKLKQ